MKTINEIISETLQIDEAVSQEIIDKCNTDDDVACIGLLKAVMNNWYHYAWLHSNGNNTSKFKSADVTNFRNALKNIATGNDLGNLKAHNEELINLINDIYKTMKTIKSDNFADTMSTLEGFAPKVSKLSNVLKKAQKAFVSDQVLVKESIDDE